MSKKLTAVTLMALTAGVDITSVMDKDSIYSIYRENYTQCVNRQIREAKYRGRKLNTIQCMKRLRAVGKSHERMSNTWLVEGERCGNKTWGMLDFLQANAGIKIIII